MTNEDKKIVADYMGWKWSEYGGDYYYIPNNGKTIWYDLNDAGLVVAKMQKRKDWSDFYKYVTDHYCNLIENNEAACGLDNLTAWLFNAENFFDVFVAWRKVNTK
jgi:hypothetical protein